MKTYLVLLLFSLVSCGQNCKELPSSYKNHEEAKTIILNANFKITDNCDVSESSFITSADYYSCDGLVGYFIVGINEKKYIFQNLPYEVWEGFKYAESKGRYFNKEIKGIRNKTWGGVLEKKNIFVVLKLRYDFYRPFKIYAP